jgi:hypothetical protein
MLLLIQTSRAKARAVFLVALALVAADCAKAPPTLSPAATAAFRNTRVIKVLDLLRDTAQDAHAQPTPLVSEESARRVTEWHQSALKVIDASTTGWKATVETGLVEVFDNLPAQEQQLLAPYFELAKVIVGQIPEGQ